MVNRGNLFLTRVVFLLLLALAYFVIFPQDWADLLSLVEGFLAVSNAASPWLYALLGVGLVCWTMIRIWGRKAVETRQREAG